MRTGQLRRIERLEEKIAEKPTGKIITLEWEGKHWPVWMPNLRPDELDNLDRIYGAIDDGEE